jgi:hypothetical protein
VNIDVSYLYLSIHTYTALPEKINNFYFFLKSVRSDTVCWSGSDRDLYHNDTHSHSQSTR